MKDKEYIIIHGLGGSPQGHWQDFLYKELQNQGKKVLFPQFPNNSQPSLEDWICELHGLKEHIHENTVVIAHSMGVILWLHYISKYIDTRINKAILVAPPSREFLVSHDFAKSFADFSLDKENFHRVNLHSLLIASTNDEYCLPSAWEKFGKILDLDYLELAPEAGHINMASGYGKWQDFLKHL